MPGQICSRLHPYKIQALIAQLRANSDTAILFRPSSEIAEATLKNKHFKLILDALHKKTPQMWISDRITVLRDGCIFIDGRHYLMKTRVELVNNPTTREFEDNPEIIQSHLSV